jgi:pimeloyl-ACP methyl ester carboxylesterase
MPFLSFGRFVAATFSLVVLAIAVYLLASWATGGEQVTLETGRVVRAPAEPWRLLAGLALLAWSFLGRFVVVAVAARRDVHPIRPTLGAGRMERSPSGAELFIQNYGAAGGPPVILTHGWAMDASFWKHAKHDLGDRFRLTLWDLPGLGRSYLAPPEHRVDLADYAADLAFLVDQAEGRPVLVGHSLGGMVIQTLLRDRPEIMERLAGLVLLNTTYTNPLKTMALSGLAQATQPLSEVSARLAIWLAPLVKLLKWQSYFSGSAHLAMRLGFGRYVTHSELEHVTRLATLAPPDVEAKGNLTMFHWDAAGALERAGLPTLVIAGARDIVTRPEASRVIAEQVPRGRLETVEDANHMGPLERDEIYNRLIGDFVLGVQPSATRDVRPDVAAAGRAMGDPGAPTRRPPPQDRRDTPRR